MSLAAGAAPAAPVPAPVHLPPSGLAAALLRADEPPPPDDDRGCDILSYDLDLRLDPAAKAMLGNVAVGFAPLADGLDTLRLDLVAALRVTRVTRRGGDAAFRHDGESLRIVLDPPPAAGRPDTVTIAWHGEPPAHGAFNAGLMFRSHDAGTPADRSDDVPVVFNISEPWSAHAWWPCKDLPADKAIVSMAVTLPDTLAMMGNGTLLAVDDADPGWRRWNWREAYPIAPYLVSVAASDYVGWDEDCVPPVGGPVPLEFRVFPQDSLRAAHDFARTCAMVELMTALAGPWPFAGEKYAQAEIKWLGAMEHQTATSYSQFLLTGTGYWENFIIHELAHQWFGDSLTPAVWADIWLNEGFARYCEALWVEQTQGRAGYRDFMLQIGPRTHPDLFSEDGLLGDPDPILPNLLVYDKGAWLLHALRLLVGDEAFFAFLLDYATEPRSVLGNVTGADVQAAAERAAGRDLSAFFAAWLGTTAVTELAADWTVAPAGGGSARVSLTLEQRQQPVFPVAVPVEIRSTAGVSRQVALLETGRRTFDWTVPGAVTAVTVDPDSLVLMRRAGHLPPPLVVTGPWPNPVPPAGARFTVTTTVDGPVQVGIFDLAGRRLDTQSLGSLSADAPFAWDWTPVLPDGSRVPSGVVWLEFRSPAGRSVHKALVLH